MTKGTVLIVVKDKNNIAEDIKKKTQFKIDILETIINKERIKEFNEKANVEYDYIIFYEKINFVVELKNYIPLNYTKKNQIFINEILLNPIIISNIEDRINNKEIIEIGILLKHIIRNAIPKEQFNIEKEVEKIKSFNNYDEEITKIFKTRLYRIIEKYYIRNSFFRTLKYKVNRDRIIKDFIYKVLENIEKDIQKNTNNQLVFKEFFGIII